MSLRTTVKASNIANLSDARYCAGMGVEMIGFSMDAGSAHFVEPKKYHEMRAWVAGVQIVGQTESDNVAEVESLLAVYAPDVLEVSYPEIIQKLSGQIPLIYKIVIDGIAPDDLDDLLQLTRGKIAFALLESNQNEPLNEQWTDFLGLIAHEHPILLGFGITANNARTLTETIPVKGIGLAGSYEIKPGQNDFGVLMDVLEQLEQD